MNTVNPHGKTTYSRVSKFYQLQNIDMREYSFILAGRVAVGKTSIYRQLQKRGLSHSEEYSRGARIHEDLGLQQMTIEMEIDNKDIKVILWDTGGLERYESMTANYYRNAHAVLLVYDLGAPDTLVSLNEWVDEARGNNRWGERLVFAMLGNKRDLKEDEYAIRDETIRAFAQQHRIDPHMLFKVSTHNRENIQRVFHIIAKFVDDKFTNLGEDQEDTDHPEDMDTLARLALSMSENDQNTKKCGCTRR